MMKPVKIGQLLKIQAKIVRVDRRKVHAIAELVDPSQVVVGESEKKDVDDTSCVHARADGLVILNRGVISGH
jgi:predicted thioesterase